MIEGKSTTILLADDDPGDQELTRRALQEGKYPGDLRVVEDGEEALDYLFRRGVYRDPESSPRPDLMLLDLNMPRMGGREVLEEIRKKPQWPPLTIVVLTTSAQQEDIRQAYELGVSSFITKPVDVDQFSHTIQVLQEYWFRIVALPGGEN